LKEFFGKTIELVSGIDFRRFETDKTVLKISFQNSKIDSSPGELSSESSTLIQVLVKT